MFNRDSFQWTNLRIDELKSMWNDGASSGQIAAHFHGSLTREAVLGKIYRLRQAGELQTRQKDTEARKPRRLRHGPAKAFKPRPAYVPPSEPVENPDLQVPFIETKPHHCRWIYGDVTSHHVLCCGDVTVRGEYWCSRHYHMVHTKPRYYSQIEVAIRTQQYRSKRAAA